MDNKKETGSLVKWESIRSACVEGGMSFTEASNHFGIKFETIRTRASREDWQTPNVMKAKAQRMLREVKAEEEEEMKIAIRADRVDYAKKREKHRKQMMEVLDEVLDREIENGFSKVKVNSIRDLEVLDTIMRRTMGMDIDDANEGKLMTLDFSKVKPAIKEAKVEEIEVDVVEVSDA